ncbi:metallopeptidase family protein [Candidatus Saccharibacteria bacterium]|jgi:predicted Zn-dependent protease with MMP-like domain|nr:metallopeptidase family protein [Candidatus Saccharibacteria bacterium]MCA9336278.1 metallopeptidase family protein [Candidatus Saccharibacteria bacterium]
MREISTDKEFDAMIVRAMAELPQQYIENLDNVAITFEDQPTHEQLQKQGVNAGSLLLGLYEGTPLTARFSTSYSGVLPDKITLFKVPIHQVSHDEAALFEQVKRTLWHEIAHHYGLDHSHIDQVQNPDQA